jgi:hypothetical protein
VTEPVKIYQQAVHIVAIKPEDHRCDPACVRAKHTYIHKFSKAVRVWGMPNGDIVLSTKKPRR